MKVTGRFPPARKRPPVVSIAASTFPMQRGKARSSMSSSIAEFMLRSAKRYSRACGREWSGSNSRCRIRSICSLALRAVHRRARSELATRGLYDAAALPHIDGGYIDLAILRNMQSAARNHGNHERGLSSRILARLRSDPCRPSQQVERDTSGSICPNGVGRACGSTSAVVGGPVRLAFLSYMHDCRRPRKGETDASLDLHSLF